eukprot:6322639-Pyramimonas_sp.AAC.2
METLGVKGANTVGLMLSAADNTVGWMLSAADNTNSLHKGSVSGYTHTRVRRVALRQGGKVRAGVLRLE